MDLIEFDTSVWYEEFISMSKEPKLRYRSTLNKIILSNKNTQYGKHHAFDRILNYEDLCYKVPLSDYETYRDVIQKEIIDENKPNILSSLSLTAIYTTSGTTGKPKFIPTSTPDPFEPHCHISEYLRPTNNEKYIAEKIKLLCGEKGVIKSLLMASQGIDGKTASGIPYGGKLILFFKLNK